MWLSPPNNLTIDSREVHLWLTHLDVPEKRLLELRQILSHDEIDRADKFYFEQHRRRFIVARATLRIILASYLKFDPQQVQFEYSSRGKPSLAKPIATEKLQFNVSHSQELALYGFSRDHAIGVDLEYLRPMPDAEKIAKRFFSEGEYRLISTLPASVQQITFFRGWTAKEAYLKATGDGLGGALDKVEVSLIPDTPMRLLSIQGDRLAATQWHLYDFVPAPNYVAAVAVEGQDWQLKYWQSD